MGAIERTETIKSAQSKSPVSGFTDKSASESVRLMKVMTNYGCGGTEKQVYNLVKRLNRKQFDLQFACLKKSGFFLETFEDQKIPIEEFPISNLYSPNTYKQQLRLAKYLKAQRIQIMHSYNFYSNVFSIPAARMAGVPLILASIRDRGVNLTTAQKLVQKCVCMLADRILVNAESIRDWLLEEGYPSSKITIIKNGLDLSLYEQAPKATTIRTEYNLPADAPLVIMLSRLNPQKGVDDFIKAAALVNRHHPDTHYLVVGEKLTYQDGEMRADSAYVQQLEQLAINLGMGDKIIFTGHRSDVAEILAESAISVLPSHSEGLSNTLLESMAAGLPIVATNVGGNPELVKDNQTGFLVPPEAPGILADAIERLLADPEMRQRFGKQAKKTAFANFSMERMVELTEQLYLSELAVIDSSRS